ncbi:hypothetical protein ACQY0O_000886 [Thecaphora frezii]
MDAASKAGGQEMPPPSLPPRTPAHDSANGDSSNRQARPKRAVRPSAKALMAREASPDAWEHGGRSSSNSNAAAAAAPRSTRIPTGNRPQIRLKMRQAGGAAGGLGQGPKTKPYMQGFDRELDSEDDETGEGLAFEEQLILRMPEGPDCDKLREAVSKRQVGDDVWFKFKDSRRAVFHVGDALYSAKLVDLPSIIESHKTLDNRQFFKIADISQMLLVEDRIQDESQASGSSSGKGFDINDFIYPHGITPPMKWARKRRFRKRAPRRAIETVEKEVERLLKEDKKAEEVQYEVFDTANGLPPDLEDDEAEGNADGQGEDDDGRSVSASVAGVGAADTPRPMGSDDEGTQLDDGEERSGAGPSAGRSRNDDDDEEDEEEDDDDDVDEDLAAELDAALEEEEDAESMRGAGSEVQSRASDQEDLWDDDDDDDGGEDEDEEDVDEDENDDEKEARVREAQLEAECREIEALVRRKQADVDSTMNMIIKSRHQQALRKLMTERDIKRSQLADVKQSRREKKEAKAAAAAAAEAAQEKEAQAQAQRDASAAASGTATNDGDDAAARDASERLVRGSANGGPALTTSMPPPAFPPNRSATAAATATAAPTAAPVPMDVDVTPANAGSRGSTGQGGGSGDDDDDHEDDNDLWDDGDDS